jgi:hypothetical protein
LRSPACGHRIALIFWLTVKEPPRGLSDGVSQAVAERSPVRPCSAAHALAAGVVSPLTLAAALLGGLVRERRVQQRLSAAFHQMSAAEAGY